MQRLLITLLLAVGVASLNAQSSIAGVGFYGTTPTAMLNGGAGYGATAYAPASFTLTGYNATGLTPGSTTYTSGITATGTVTQTCTLTFSSSGSPITAAVGTVRLSTTNTVAAGSVVTFTTVGTGYGSVPTTAVATNGTATCSGTVAVSTALGAYAPFAVDAAGNISAGALLGYTIPTLTAGCLQSAGTTGPLSWATCGSSGGGLSGMTTGQLPVAASASTVTSSIAYTTAATASTVVERDSSNNINATTFTGALSGNASTATSSTTAANLSGAPAVPNGTTATTQSQADGSTKLATTAYVDTGLGTKAAAGASTTVNGQTCTLGSTCTISVPAAQVAANLANSSSTGVTGQLPIGQVGSAGLSASGGVAIASTGAISLSAIPNSALANPATTVNGQTCTLGSTCTVPIIAPCSAQISNGSSAITAGTYTTAFNGSCLNVFGATYTISHASVYSDNAGGSSTCTVTDSASNAVLSASTAAASAWLNNADANISGTHNTVASGVWLNFSIVADGTSKKINCILTTTR